MGARPEDVLGEGAFRYVAAAGWARLPPGRRFVNVAAVGVDSRDNIYVFDRGPHPLTVLDRDGNFLRSWGERQFKRPHAVHVGPDDTLWLTDDANHVVRNYASDGRLLLEIGMPGRPGGPYMSGVPFNRCTHTAVSPEGDIYVSDGYANARVHKYSPDGRLLLSWGRPGTDPGEFNIPHNITCDGDGWVYVADRENHRVQVFDWNGRYETQWSNLHRPCGMYMRPGRCPLCYIAEAGAALDVNRDMPNIGPRVSILDHTGARVGRFGGLRGGKSGSGGAVFLGNHGITADSRGNIYVADLAAQTWDRLHPDEPSPDDLTTLHKFTLVARDTAAHSRKAAPREAGIH
jgi:DNA-binding beta-propeller fold protein YncE